MTCTRCESTGFLNLHQVPDDVRKRFDESGDVNVILEWMKAQTVQHGVSVCDCCGDGDNWHGEPGQHYTGGDKAGQDGPYAYNGGLPECT